ncbi:hypothetical protein BS47DRAFT_266504 [Hydnum rufescens UP504]|uniref:Uncharacterized protein n=1 Tax=Hydnum rufescens UP504 TaxID=1448309 RepID=A0A9P6ALU8_9AGAM|nr:hypothetical protein BS47DRAFT_266504 [Hydnum rufescens UP504]
MALKIIRPGPLNGRTISQKDLCKAYRNLLDKLEDGISTCLFQRRQGMKSLRHFNPSIVDDLRILDDVNNIQPGHSFLSLEDVHAHHFDLLNAVLKEQPGAIFNTKGSKPVLDKQKLAGGTPSRCPQMEGLLVENIEGRRRNILSINNLILWVTFDDTKSSSVTGRDKIIPHWFPQETQLMVRQYLVFIRPFVLYLLRNTGNDHQAAEFEAEFFYWATKPNFQKVWDTFELDIGFSCNVRDWRGSSNIKADGCTTWLATQLWLRTTMRRPDRIWTASARIHSLCMSRLSFMSGMNFCEQGKSSSRRLNVCRRQGQQK